MATLPLPRRVTAFTSTLLACVHLAASTASAQPIDTPAIVAESAAPTRDEGLRFTCDPRRVADVRLAVDAYLASLDIPDALVNRRSRPAEGVLVYTLSTPAGDTSTVDLHRRPEMGIASQVEMLPSAGGGLRAVETVSRKEVVLALMQHGRLTEFHGDACSVDALAQHVEVRRSIVAWSEELAWGWPDGGPARWNDELWDRGTPRDGVDLRRAFEDVFLNQRAYAFGCYTATKVAMVQGILDYYGRVQEHPAPLSSVQERLLADRDPLVDVEPAAMWSFDPTLDASELQHPGKVLRIQYGVAPRNFIPGDWVYFLNPDPASSRKTGFEGSNAIYLGRGRFDDYYGEHGHAYAYAEKLDEVYQWRHGVFEPRDAFRRVPIDAEAMERLEGTPAQGGLVMDLRVFPDFFHPSEPHAAVVQQVPADAPADVEPADDAHG